ncbi:MAG: lauroyl acyltransferase [Pseudomonadota bacterium]
MAKKRRNPYFLRYVRYPLESAGLYLALGILSCLPIDSASNLGGWLGRNIGYRLGVTRRAKRNLKLAFPEKPEQEIDQIAKDMWDNLGRVAAEYGFLGEICDPKSGRVELVDVHGSAILDPDRYPCIAASGHLANWEVMPVSAASYGVPITTIIRDPNNPMVRDKLHRLRIVAGGSLASKGPEGAKLAMAALRDKKVLGILVDQKFNEGIEVPFFGYPAKTATAAAQFTLRYKSRLLPIRLERTGPARFRITCYPEIEPPNSGKLKDDVEIMVRQLTETLEGWIRERPAEWLWLHRRWPDRVYQEAAQKGLLS